MSYRAVGLALLFLTSIVASAAPAAFVFQDDFDCAGLPDAICTQYKNTTQPHSWSEDEKLQILALTKKVRSDLPVFMSKVESASPIKIRRLTQGAQWDKQKMAFVPFPYFGDAGLDGMDLTDLAFNKDPGIQNVFGATILEHVFVHELGHIYDDASKTISMNDPFLSLTHWITGTTSDGQRYVTGLDLPNYNLDEVYETNAKMRDLFIQKAFLDGVNLTHSYGMKFNHPSSYAMTNPIEDFAESLSWIYLDSKCATYLPASLIRYFRSEILK